MFSEIVTKQCLFFTWLYCNNYIVHLLWGDCGSTVVKVLCHKSLVQSQLVSLEYFMTKFFRSHYGRGVDSASNRNEYQEYFLGVKAAGA